MQENTFITETDARYVKRQLKRSMLPLFAIFTALSCLGFLVAWQTFIFFEIISMASLSFAYFLQTRRGQDYVLSFEGDRLYIHNRTTSESYEVYDIPASDFVIKQTKKEIGLNYCSVIIRGTVFGFGGVKNCKELKEYIAANYK